MFPALLSCFVTVLQLWWNLVTVTDSSKTLSVSTSSLSSHGLPIILTVKYKRSFITIPRMTRGYWGWNQCKAALLLYSPNATCKALGTPASQNPLRGPVCASREEGVSVGSRNVLTSTEWDAPVDLISPLVSFFSLSLSLFIHPLFVTVPQ